MAPEENVVLQVMLDGSRRDQFDDVVRALEHMGGVVVMQLPEAGLLAVRIAQRLTDDVKRIDSVAIVEQSRTLSV